MTVRLRILKDRLVLKALGLAVTLFGSLFAAVSIVVELAKSYPFVMELAFHVVTAVFCIVVFTWIIHGWLERRTDAEHKRQIKSEWEQRHRIG